MQTSLAQQLWIECTKHGYAEPYTMMDVYKVVRCVFHWSAIDMDQMLDSESSSDSLAEKLEGSELEGE